MLKVLRLLTKKNIKYIILTEEYTSQKLRLKNIDEMRHHFIEEIKQNELMSNKHNNVCGVLNYIEQLLIIVSNVSISAFASLTNIPVCIANSAAELKIYVITAGINNYKLMIKEEKKT